jgi:hypothetical protein
MSEDPFAVFFSLHLQQNTPAFGVRTSGVETAQDTTPGKPPFIPAFPLHWLTRLAPLPGKTLAVYLVLYFRSRVERSRTVTLTTATLEAFGISRREKQLALQRLEQTGLITVERRPRRNPRVTLVLQR